MEEAQHKRRRIGLRTRLLGAFVLFALLPMLAIPTLLSRKLSEELVQIERNELRAGVRQLEQAIATSQAKLLQSTQDYGHWDQAVQNFQARNANWFQQEVFEYVVKNYQYDFVLVTDLEGNVLWNFHAPERLRETVASMPVFMEAITGDEKVDFSYIGDALANVAAARIMPLAHEDIPAEEADVVGVLIFGDLVDNAYAEVLASTIGRDVVFYSQTEILATNAYAMFDAHPLLTSGTLEGINEYVYPDYLHIAVPVRAADGTPVGRVRMAQSRAAINYVRVELSRTVIFLFFAGILTFVVLALVLRSALILPVIRIIDAVTGFAKHRTFKTKGLVERTDELGDLARTIGEMVKDLKESECALLAREKQLRASNAKLTHTTKELEEKIQEVQRLNKFMIGREVRMVELKKEMRSMEARGGVKESGHK